MSAQYQFTVKTHGRGLINMTERVSDYVAKSNIQTGICHLFLHHTSASLILCENADPLVQSDLEMFMARFVTDGDSCFQHTTEGPDDMSAHIRTVLTQSFLAIPITNQKLNLGIWQGIYLWEHRLRPFERKLTVTVIG